jgi:hypothetical protein
MSFLFIGGSEIAKIPRLTAAGANLKNDHPRTMCGICDPAQTSALKFIIDIYNETEVIFAGDTHMYNGIKDRGSAPYTSWNAIDKGKVSARTNSIYREILKPRAN